MLGVPGGGDIFFHSQLFSLSFRVFFFLLLYLFFALNLLWSFFLPGLFLNLDRLAVSAVSCSYSVEGTPHSLFSFLSAHLFK